MTREETRNIIQSAIAALGNYIAFGSGRITEFNSKEAKQYPFIWLESLSSSTPTINYQGANIDNYNCKLHIAMKDQPDSIETQYEAIVDKCDYIAQQLIGQVKTILSAAALITLTSVARDPFIHKHADDTTGVILSLTLVAPDTTNVCNP